MNILKIQTDALKALVKETKCGYYHTADGRVFLTILGSVGYYLSEEELRLNLLGAQAMLSVDATVENAVTPLNRLTGTDEYRVGGTVRKYLRDDYTDAEVYVDTGLLKYFDNPVLYQKEGERAIAVTEQPVGALEPKIVGIVMPYNFKKN